MILVGVLGTTISPYMFFWQASQQIEEDGAAGKTGKSFIGKLIRDMRIDTFVGMIFSEIAAWFIMLTTGEVLYRHGVRDIPHRRSGGSRRLQPFVSRFPHAGKISGLLFVFGIIGTGLLAVPIFAATSAYALCDCFGFRDSLNLHSQGASFLWSHRLGTVVGVLLNYVNIDPIKALIYSAVLNGVVAVPMIFLLIRIAGRKDIMGSHVSGPVSRRLRLAYLRKYDASPPSWRAIPFSRRRLMLPLQS